MSDDSQAADKQAQVVLLTQYVRDLSFESPNAPGIFQTNDEDKPQINVNVGVRVNQMGSEGYETVMSINVEAKAGEKVAFLVELEYGSLWGIRGVPQEHLPPLLLVECPRLMFPFARRVLADAIRDGGFPPVLLEPVDFAALYRAQHQPVPEGVKPN
jgi:preprotein translocase subunit SecB